MVANAANGSTGHEHQEKTRDRASAAGGDGASPPLLENIQPPGRTPDYNWNLAGLTECSASCGRGQSWGGGGFGEVLLGTNRTGDRGDRQWKQLLSLFRRTPILSLSLRVTGEPGPGIGHLL